MGEDANNKPGPISWLICGACGIVVLVLSLLVIPAAELIPAHVYPAKRESGESPVRSDEIMSHYGAIGVQIINALNAPKPASADKNPVENWHEKMVAEHGEEHAKKNVIEEIKKDFSKENLEKMIELLSTEESRNFVYNAYALFLGLALFAGAVAIQAMGRWGAEEKTILPAKK